jgi:flagellar motor switch protein FliM
MSEGLSNEAVAQFVGAVREGRLPGDADRHVRRSRRVRSVDFRRPTKFSHEQERRLQAAHEPFCRTASTRLSTELRADIELEVVNIAQLTWLNAHGELTASSICGVLEGTEHPGSRMLLAAELPLVVAMIELMVGGTLDGAPEERRLTDIDWALAAHLLGVLTGQLSLVWDELLGLGLRVAGLDTHVETGQLAAPSEPTLQLTLEVRLNRERSNLVLLVPYRAIEPVVGALGALATADERPHEVVEALHGAVGGIEVEVRAEVGSVDLPVHRVLALQPGDVVRLGTRAADGITVLAAEVPVHRALPGRSGARRAVQVIGDAEGVR